MIAKLGVHRAQAQATQDELELQLIAAPAATWEDAADKARYLLAVLATTSSGQDSPPKDIDPSSSR